MGETPTQKPENHRGPPTEADPTISLRKTKAADRPSGTRRGPFTIVGPHAQGGLGLVSLAQDGTLKRTVALKEIRPDRLGVPFARERFLIEAEITGQLEHPGIVPVHALDHDEAGNPYYAMRFVQGHTLDAAIAAYHQAPTPLAFRGLLQRYVAVCRTIAYAHSKGVIHRDLKPTNVMLGDFGETLVLDWGLAKVLAAGDPEPAGQTAPPRGPTTEEGADQTLALAREEGGRASTALTVDGPSGKRKGDLTESGQILGTPAFMAPEQGEGNLAQVGPAADVYALGAILYQLLTGSSPYEGGPLQILQHLRDGPPPAPRQRRRGLPRRLEAVCLKAMARAIPDRYATALALAEDVERYLADEPVSVYREPWAARAGRWVRRHRLAVTGGVALLAAAVPLLILLALHSDRARRRAQTDRATIEDQKRQVETALERATRSREFLQNEVIAAVRPRGLGLGKDVTMKEVLDAAVPKIGPTFAGYPEDEAAICLILGKSYVDLGENDQAEPLFRRSKQLRQEVLGPDHPDTLTSLRQHAGALAGLGKTDEAVQSLREALPTFRGVLGEEHFSTRQAMKALGNAYGRQNKFDEAERLIRDCWEIERRALGDAHEETLETQVNLGGLLFMRGKLAEAEPLLRAGWEGLRRQHGKDHPSTLVALTNLATVLHLQRKWSEAAPLLREVVVQRRAILGDDHPQTLRSQHNLGALLREKGDWEEAESVYREVLTRRRQALPPGHRSTRGTQFHLAALLRERGKLTEAEALARDLIALYREKPLSGTSGPAADLMLLASILLRRDEAVEAEKLLREALAIFQKDKPQGGHEVSEATGLLGSSLAAQKRFEDAEPLLLQSYADLESSPAAPPSLRHEAVGRLIHLYQAWGKPEQAARWQAKREGDRNLPNAGKP